MESEGLEGLGWYSRKQKMEALGLGDSQVTTDKLKFPRLFQAELFHLSPWIDAWIEWIVLKTCRRVAAPKPRDAGEGLGAVHRPTAIDENIYIY